MHKRWFQVLTSLLFTVFIVTTLSEAQEESPQRRRENRQGDGPGEGRARRGRGQLGGRSGDLLSLLRIKEVRKEIGLEKEQGKAVDEIAKKLRGERGARGDRRNFRDLSDEERTQLMAELREAGQKRAAKAKELLTDVLNKQQFNRLTEIRIQVAGIRALNDNDVATQLDITDEQQGKIEAAEEANRENMREAMRELRGSNNREAAMKKMAELRESAESSVLAILTKEQQAQFAEMKGKKFEMPQRGFGGRQRGDRPRRNRKRDNNNE